VQPFRTGANETCSEKAKACKAHPGPYHLRPSRYSGTSPCFRLRLQPGFELMRAARETGETGEPGEPINREFQPHTA